MKIIIYLLLSVLFCFACKRKEPTTWETSIQAPLVKTSLTLQNLIQDSVLIVNSDNSVTLNYQVNFDVLNQNELFKIPNDTLVDTLNYSFVNPVPFNPGTQLANINSSIVIDYGDARLKEMKIKSGGIRYTLTNQVNGKLIYIITIPKSINKNGVAFTKTIEVPPGTPNNPSVFTSFFDLSDNTIDLRGVSGASINTLETNIKVILDPNGGVVNISQSDSAFAQTIVTDIQPEYVKGYLGQFNILEPNQKIAVDLFKNISATTLDLNQVKVNLQLKNYVGADLQMKLTNLVSNNSKTNSNVSLTHAIINQPINFSRASLSSYGLITPVAQEFELNSSNSNIKNLLENLGDSLFTGFDLSVNPLGNISGGNDFIFLKNTFAVGMGINMPLSFIAKDLVLMDTVAYSNINASIENGTFKVVAENFFPLDAKLQFYILNENNVIVDSIFNNSVIYAGIPNGSGKVITPTKTTLTSMMPAYKIQLLNNNKKLVTKAVFNTVGSSPITIYDSYSLDVKLIGDFNYKATLK